MTDDALWHQLSIYRQEGRAIGTSLRRVEAFLDELEAIRDDLRRVVMSCEELALIQSN